MKKRFFAILFVLVLTLGSMLGACGGRPSNTNGDDGGNTVDDGKQKIYFNVFNGGFGTEWATHAADMFNKTQEEYQIKVNPTTNEWGTLEAGFKAGTLTGDIFLNSPDYTMAKKLGWFEDLTDVYSSKPDGDKTVYEKIKDRDKDYVDTVHKDGDKYYAIPFQDGFMGFVYDHDMFLEKGFLIGENGECIANKTQTLSAGRDGKPGTFDDGHPTNLTEYDKMINKIKQSNMSVYLWAGQLPYYVTNLYSAIFAEYDGVANYKKSFTLEGDYTNPKTGSSFSFTKENGYKTFEMQGRYEAFNFMYKYMDDPLNYHADSAKTGTDNDKSHTDFVINNANNKAKSPAFLYEGTWWEHESKTKFTSLVENNHPEYAYGTRDYRFMMLPKMNEYQQENGYVLPVFDSMSLFVKKQTDSAKSAVIKQFLTFLHTDEQMCYFTSTTGGFKPFDYELTETDLSKMTKFAKNCYEIYTSDSIQIVRTMTDKYRYNDYYTMGIGIADTRINNIVYHDPINVMLRVTGDTTPKPTAQDMFDGAKTYFSEKWSEFLSKLS